MTGPAPLPDGLRSLDPQASALLRRLDDGFAGWAAADGADAVITPALLPVEDLAALDVYDNFPHQALVACALDLGRRQAGGRGGRDRFDPAELEPAVVALPTAACFAVYLGLRGARLDGGRRVTVLGRCFRQEDRYDRLRRLLGFHMREVVALGTREFVIAHLRAYEDRIAAFAAALDLPLRKEAATDPFYDRGGQRALLQRLSPVKHEFLSGDLAIASLNVHRNFFGERCDIRLANTGELAHTGCVAFGLERWLAVLWDRYGGWDEAAGAVAAATSEPATAPTPSASPTSTAPTPSATPTSTAPPAASPARGA